MVTIAEGPNDHRTLFPIHHGLWLDTHEASLLLHRWLERPDVIFNKARASVANPFLCLAFMRKSTNVLHS
jgi:hypothetical protein